MQEMDDDAAREILQRSLADEKAALEQAPNHPANTLSIGGDRSFTRERLSPALLI